MKQLTLEQIEQAHEYMVDHWITGDASWSDFAIADQAGDTEMLAHMLVSAGAINSNICYEWAKSVEQVVEHLAKNFRKLNQKERRERYNEAFKDCLIVQCEDCNRVSCVHSGNERIYPELLKQCWECKSENIQTQKGLEQKREA